MRAIPASFLMAVVLLGACDGPIPTTVTPKTSPPLASVDVGYGPNLFYYLRHDPTPSLFSTFGTISTSGIVQNRFGVGNGFVDLTFVGPDLGYGANLFYYVRFDGPSGQTFLGTISSLGIITDKFSLGSGVIALTFVAADLGYGTNQFYYLRRSGTSSQVTFGTISLSGLVTDRFGLGSNYDALTFVAANIDYGPNLFYYLRHDELSGEATFGTFSTSGVQQDRFSVGPLFEALTFASDNLGYGANQFYALRRVLTTGRYFLVTISTKGIVQDRFDVGEHFDALTFAADVVVSVDIKPGTFPNTVNLKSGGKIPVAILSTATFNATTVDPATVRFGKAGTEASAVHFAFSDANADGTTDIVLQFTGSSTGITCGDVVALLNGRTNNGVSIRGSDTIVTTGCP